MLLAIQELASVHLPISCCVHAKTMSKATTELSFISACGQSHMLELLVLLTVTRAYFRELTKSMAGHNNVL